MAERELGGCRVEQERRAKNARYVRHTGTWALIAACGLTALSACSTGEDGGSDPEGSASTPPPEASVNFRVGDIVGEFEMAAPAQTSFLLRGTLPLPPGMYMPGSSESPFLVFATGQTPVSTQVEVVSRYPSSTEGADVVEILAQVDRPSGSGTGSRIVYNIQWSPNTPGTMQMNAGVQNLLATPGALVLRSTDVFGHSYEANLLQDLINDTDELRTFRDGHVARQIRTYENLVPVAPVAGSLGTLPHMMGAHAYITTWNSEQFFSLDVRLHNGHEGFDPATDQDDPVGQLYFNELELVVPSGWSVFQAYESPSLGTQYVEGSNNVLPLVAPLSANKMHVMPIQTQFHRRLIVCRTGAETRALAVLGEKWLAFCRDGENENEERFLSWWNPGSARYWAQNLPLPTLDQLGSKANQRGALEVKFDGLEQLLLDGAPSGWPLISGMLGWAHPWGEAIGYSYGGSEIYWWDGLEALWTASNEGYRTFQISHRRYTERHDTALYSTNGDAYQLEKWLVEGPTQTYLPTWIFMIPWLPLADPHGFSTADSFQVDAVEAQGRKPAYEDALLDYDYIDEGHLIRYTRSPKVLVWAGNDALSKDDLRLQAELCRTTYAPYPQSDGGATIVTGYIFDSLNVFENPGEGIDIDRTEGWGLDTVAAYYSLADDSWRSLAKPWTETIVDLYALGQTTCDGFIMAMPHPDHLGGQYRLIQSISESIIENGLWGVKTSIFDRADEVYAARTSNIIKRSVKAMNGTKVWNPGAAEYNFYTALGPYDQNEPPFCDFVPGDGTSGLDNWQTWNVLLFGYLLTGESFYLNRVAVMGGSSNPDVLGSDEYSGELESRAGVVALLQNMLLSAE